MAGLKTVLRGQVAQAPWKTNWLGAQASWQVPHGLTEYPGAHVHFP